MDDLISRQAAKDALDGICGRECEYSKKQRTVMCASCHLGSAFDAIDELPFIDPVKHGRWLKTEAFPHHVYCSECNNTYIPNDRWQIWTDGDLPRKYCPNCGAKMDMEGK